MIKIKNPVKKIEVSKIRLINITNREFGIDFILLTDDGRSIQAEFNEFIKLHSDTKFIIIDDISSIDLVSMFIEKIRDDYKDFIYEIREIERN